MRRLIAIVLVFCASAAAADTRIEMTRYFDLHSDPWLNLHHFLYQWARADVGLGEGRQYVSVPERQSLNSLGEEGRKNWIAALEFFRENVAPLSHFDNQMLRQKFALLRLEGDTSGKPASEIEGIGEVLELAMPTYLEYWWSDHDEGNRRWVANIARQLNDTEADFVAMTERLFGAEWPSEARRIDVSAYANFRAGYTALGHTVMFSSDPGVEGIYGLEMLYHEVQHVREISRPFRTQLVEAFQRRDMEVPDNLAHGIIFGTAGAFSASIADQFGEKAHTSYWEREGFAELASWAAVFEAVNRYWVPAATGNVTPANALDNIAGYFEAVD